MGATLAAAISAARCLLLPRGACILVRSRAGPAQLESWGINSSYKPVNRPAAGVLRRGAGEPLRGFYAAALATRAPKRAAPAAVRAAERAAGVAAAPDGGVIAALVVPWSAVPLVAAAFPGVRMRRYESAHDAWSSEVVVADAAEGRSRLVNVFATRYAAIVDATGDKELWAAAAAAAARAGGGAAAAAGAAAEASGAGATASIDVLVHAHYDTLEGNLVTALARRGWAGREGDAGFWLVAGTPCVAADAPEPVVAIAPEECSAVVSGSGGARPWRVPLAAFFGGDNAARRAEAVGHVLRVLEALSPAGWLRATPPVAVLDRYTVADVERDLTAAAASGEGGAATAAAAAAALLAPLPVAPAAVLAWLADGRALAAGTIALVDAVDGGNDVARIKALPLALRHVCGSDSHKYLAALGAATARAEMVVFYCNRASSRSPDRAAAFAAWAAASLPLERRPRVRVVAGGVQALVDAGLSKIAIRAA